MRARWLLAWLTLVGCGRWGFEPSSGGDAGSDAPGDGGPTVGSVIAISAGGVHTCALLIGGRVRCWGGNSDGQLGRGNVASLGDDELPATGGDIEVGGPVIQIAAGREHTCALLEGGRVRCWGDGGDGRLGYGNLSNIGDDELPSAAGDVDAGGPVIQLEAGELFTCALLATGDVRCWGDNADGQLGRGNTVDIGDNETPASAGSIVLGGAATRIAVGDDHACALLATGSVRCWGDGGTGRLGYGNTATIGDNELPTSVGDVSVGGKVIQIAAADHHTCAILDTGKVRCWGEGIDGRLGHANTTTIGDNEPPSSAGDVDLGGAAVQLAAGNDHTCALLDTGAVRCWGSAAQGRLGYANTTDIGDTEPPAAAGDVELGGRVSQITAGAAHTCALLDGRVRCWGAGAHGRLGHGGATIIIGDDEAPAARPPIALGGTAEQISAGGKHTCALLTGGSVVCWGSNSDGQNGQPTRDAIGDDETPAAAGPIALGGTAVEIEVGFEHSCARLTTNTVRCWGSGSSGRLGYANTSAIGNDETPASAGDVMVGATVTDLALGTNHTCAVITGGAVQCWGNNASGQLGYGNTNNVGDNETPASAGSVTVGGAVSQLALGDGHGCALLAGGTVRCWGEGSTGELGYGNTSTIGDNETPQSAGDVQVGGTVTQLAFGGEHVCALLTGGTVRCWGSGADGQLGYGNLNNIGNNELPASAGDVQVGGAVTRLAAGEHHTCALLAGGAVRCWGRGTGGRLGYASSATIGDNEPPSAAGNVDLGGTAIDLTAGDDHTCAILSDKTVRCWGDDRGFGALGQAIVDDIGDDETPASAGDVAVE